MSAPPDDPALTLLLARLFAKPDGRELLAEMERRSLTLDAPTILAHLERAEALWSTGGSVRGESRSSL